MCFSKCFIFYALSLTLIGTLVSGATYENTMDIFRDKLGSDHYHTEVRPIKNQDNVLKVLVGFQIVAIVKVDEIAQSFISNGFVFFTWIDEMVAWNPGNYGGQFLIHPLPEDIWRPRVVLRNTLGDRDLFDDDKAPVFVFASGLVNWAPGSLFPASCELNMVDYPFDEQTCAIQLVAMSLSSDEMQFYTDPDAKVGTSYFNSNGEWELIDSTMKVSNISAGAANLSAVDFVLVLRRRPYFLMLNIVLPVVFLSFLNILVFTIPVESGEKIGYGITVLLALSVFMSIISGMLPRSSTLPRVTIYLFILLAISVLTVVDSIIIVYIYHKEEKEEKHIKAKKGFQSAFTKIKHMHRAVAPENTTKKTPALLDTIAKNPEKIFKTQASVVSTVSTESSPPTYEPAQEFNQKGDNVNRNKYKLIGKYIDLVSFVIFFVVWLAVTLAFMIDIAV
ncbi:neuronal acetylcholine receptor subunit beta-3 [Biomphalaria glabrata]|uniref:Neuronal acetylcholine receptor subunit beta-3-like n=1 Tax=Biomphalaria glabrata TaxID=6526 RepID=A0A9W3B121_BIOGL|nr:neuronal acetylcholine receptor subunit beta-3-like [Biomphalaria glabrata]KAI8757340.1 neuronal acetylcholine receptor subunit beta-3-like [Biomphalaria glabrata]